MDKSVLRRCTAIFLLGLMVALCPYAQRGFHCLENAWNMALLEARLSRTDIRLQRHLAEGYNAALKDGIQEGYDDILNIKNGIMGTVLIPKIRVHLPIYHGTDPGALSRGAGHLPQSPFPIGGGGNHSVITAHTGYPGGRLFSDLDQLAVGDTFEIHILDEIICYRVDQILTVLPEETEHLLPTQGEDYCTLVTCTPYGVNSHRLLVRGVRVETLIK